MIFPCPVRAGKFWSREAGSPILSRVSCTGAHLATCVYHGCTEGTLYRALHLPCRYPVQFQTLCSTGSSVSHLTWCLHGHPIQGTLLRLPGSTWPQQHRYKQQQKTQQILRIYRAMQKKNRGPNNRNIKSERQSRSTIGGVGDVAFFSPF